MQEKDDIAWISEKHKILADKLKYCIAYEIELISNESKIKLQPTAKQNKTVHKTRPWLTIRNCTGFFLQYSSYCCMFHSSIKFPV